MSQQQSVTSHIQNHNGIPTLFINGEPVHTSAYITYLEEHACYRDFAQAGYRLFSFPAFFGGRGINVHNGLKAFRKGIFDEKGKPDFTGFDNDVALILAARPDALIFPRVNITLPEWWERENPQELNLLYNGTPCRESFSSLKWRGEVTGMLSKLIDHIEASPYRNNIMGYHIAAGGTEEWVHFGNPLGGFGPAAEIGFAEFLAAKYPGESTEGAGEAPSTMYDCYAAGEEILSEEHHKKLLRYLEYLNWVIANAICHFATFIKQKTNRRLVVGAFYGYALESIDARKGHHDAGQVLACPDVDFLCAPCSYVYNRENGCDWAPICALDTVKLHGKLWLTECDIRTYLTKPLKEARPDICPQGAYEGGVWAGPPSPEVSLWAIRKTFARNLITGTGQWWFDMWGGWYKDTAMLRDLSQYIQVAEQSLGDAHRESNAEVALIVDEASYRHLNPDNSLSICWSYLQRYWLGFSGVPYDVYDISDLPRLPKTYKLVLITMAVTNASLGAAQFQAFMQNALSNGCSVLFSYLPFCLQNGSFSLQHSARATGFSLRPFLEEEGEKAPADTQITLQNNCQYDVFYRPQHLFYLELTPGLTKLGAYSNGRCAVAMKTVPGARGKVFYSALPELRVPLLQEVFRQSGVHVYADSNDVVYAGRHYLCIHAASAGEKTVSLPETRAITPLFLNEERPPETYRSYVINITMAQYETRAFRLD